MINLSHMCLCRKRRCSKEYQSRTQNCQCSTTVDPQWASSSQCLSSTGCRSPNSMSQSILLTSIKRKICLMKILSKTKVKNSPLSHRWLNKPLMTSSKSLKISRRTKTSTRRKACPVTHISNNKQLRDTQTSSKHKVINMTKTKSHLWKKVAHRTTRLR